MAVSFTTAVRNARLNAIVTAAGANALLRIWTGGAPSVDSAPTGTLLGTLTCAASLGSVSGGVLTLGTVTQDSAADATGTATDGRILTSDGVTTVFQCVVSATGGGGDLQLNSVSIQSGGPITVQSGSITEAA